MPIICPILDTPGFYEWAELHVLEAENPHRQGPVLPCRGSLPLPVLMVTLLGLAAWLMMLR